jgi:predicted RNA binding protein YcfA (HicA-like mRNA interferase family)
MKLEKCQSGNDFIQVAEKHKNCTECRPEGSHFNIKGTKPGRVTIAAHDYEFPPYTRRKIIQQLALIGISIFLIAIVVTQILI